jgi:hypothetical protein
VWVGEATGLISDVAPAAEILQRTVTEAVGILRRLSALTVPA